MYCQALGLHLMYRMRLILVGSVWQHACKQKNSIPAGFLVVTKYFYHPVLFSWTTGGRHEIYQV